MLNPTLFDAVRGTLRICMSYVVCHMSYVSYEIPDKVYMTVKKTKNNLEVPSNLIFTKTVSSLFVFKNINNYLRKLALKKSFFDCFFSFSLENVRSIRHTTYDIRHTIFHNGVNLEI